ncbi:MAG TPA: Imm50 family immunity protein [Bryobacteraceae bacterium]|jgi:hypothetical protein|nr:Imm50 family immunity protein [Bryobacteraceae bacterium]
MSDQNIRLEGAGAVEALFGYWPSFHDAEILRIELDRKGPRVAIDVLTDVKPGSGRYIIVRFVFHGIDDLSLEDFNHQNVIWSLELELAPENRMRITFHSIFGAALSFTCARGEVIEAAPSDLRTGHPR